jgi:hypothetical protein
MSRHYRTIPLGTVHDQHEVSNSPRARPQRCRAGARLFTIAQHTDNPTPIASLARILICDVYE